MISDHRPPRARSPGHTPRRRPTAAHRDTHAGTLRASRHCASRRRPDHSTLPALSAPPYPARLWPSALRASSPRRYIARSAPSASRASLRTTPRHPRYRRHRTLRDCGPVPSAPRAHADTSHAPRHLRLAPASAAQTIRAPAPGGSALRHPRRDTAFRASPVRPAPPAPRAAPAAQTIRAPAPGGSALRHPRRDTASRASPVRPAPPAPRAHAPGKGV